MKPVDVKNNINIDYNKDINDEDPKFKVDDHVRTSKLKNIFAKGYTRKWSEEILVIKEFKNTVSWKLLTISIVKKLLEHFMKRSTKD